MLQLVVISVSHFDEEHGLALWLSGKCINLL